MDHKRPADDDRAGGMNTLTRFADADLCTPRPNVPRLPCGCPLDSGCDGFHIIEESGR